MKAISVNVQFGNPPNQSFVTVKYPEDDLTQEERNSLLRKEFPDATAMFVIYI